MTMPNIAERMFHTPLMVAPAKAAAVVAALGPQVLGQSIAFDKSVIVDPAAAAPKKEASILDGRLSNEIRSGSRDGYVVRGGVAIIQITGTLIHRGAWLGSFSGETSYEGIAAQIEAAMEDFRVKAIALEFDSYGGEVAGCFALGTLIRKARETKPIRAFVADHCFSAAYALASQAERIIIPKSGGAGSIGVICLHIDHSVRLSELGVAVTVISAGAHKGDGNPYEPLPETVRDNMQTEMETLRGIFAESVATGRGKTLSVSDVLATEAGCFLGDEAVRLGLADEIGDPAEAFQEFVKEINGSTAPFGPSATSIRSKTMANQEKDKTEDTNDAGTTSDNASPETLSDSAAEGAAGSDQSQTSINDAVKAEQNRVLGILGCDEANGREALALSLAEDPGMSLERAKQHLSKAPLASEKTSLSQEMLDDDASLSSPGTAAVEENLVKAVHQARLQS